MPFSSDDKEADTALETGQIILEVVGLFFPPIAVAASDLKTFIDLYKFLEQHVHEHPGLSRLPGPSLVVRNPAKW